MNASVLLMNSFALLISVLAVISVLVVCFDGKLSIVYPPPGISIRLLPSPLSLGLVVIHGGACAGDASLIY